MKRIFVTILAIIFALSGCSAEKAENPEFDSPERVAEYLLEKNGEFLDAKTNSGDVSPEKRADTAENGQKPFAVVITCSDSRVPPEHIFGCGIGDLFVIRTAGNVIGDFELGSIEYGAEHLGCKLVLVLGHTSCGAVAATLEGGAHGHIEMITDEIASCLPENCTPAEAEIANVENSIERILSSEIMSGLEESGEVAVLGAIYDIETGKIEYLE